jgi:hypothetical protein
VALIGVCCIGEFSGDNLIDKLIETSWGRGEDSQSEPTRQLGVIHIRVLWNVAREVRLDE